MFIKSELVLEDRVACIVHVSAGPIIAHLLDFLKLLSIRSTWS